MRRVGIRASIVAAALAAAACCGSAGGQPVVFHDDFEDNDVSDWDIAPLYFSAGTVQNGHMYVPARADCHDGQIWGKGSGYGSPLYTWMVKPAAFDATDALALQVVGHSGTSWPNQATVYLFADTWPREGTVYTGSGQYNGRLVNVPSEGYIFRLYGESNQRVELQRQYYDGGAYHSQWLFRWNHNVVSDQTYRLERDSAGRWSLLYGDADGQNMQPAPIGNVTDLTVTSFGHVAAEMFRNQSALDYIQVQAVPEPASLALLAIGGLALVRRRK